MPFTPVLTATRIDEEFNTLELLANFLFEHRVDIHENDLGKRMGAHLIIHSSVLQKKSYRDIYKEADIMAMEMFIDYLEQNTEQDTTFLKKIYGF